ncbi:U3 small nucleolar RNA-associated protein [Favolaschia claudopus]|uniref:U3 small nucleolar RNA-associated protein n=1 Tax=Favolaschia claudopus TaxID=2862362 RepID=A0AAW0AEF9_9AGAR
MSSLKNILNNPDPDRKRSVKYVSPTLTTPFSSSNPPSLVHMAAPAAHTSPGSSSEADPADYNPLIHIPHPDCPDSLACLPDTDGRPQHTLPVILRCAILGSTQKYAYYRTAGQTWKQSVRHHLSLNHLQTDPGFGSYWTVNLLAPPGTKRPRKRGRPNKDSRAKKDEPPPQEALLLLPRKHDDSPDPDDAPASAGLRNDPSPESFRLGDDDPDSMMADEDELVDELESESEPEDECESEEKILHPFERRHSLSGGGLTPYDSSAGFHFPAHQTSPDFSSQQNPPQSTTSPPQHVVPPQIQSPPLMPSPHHVPTPQRIATPQNVASHHAPSHQTAPLHVVTYSQHPSPRQATNAHLAPSPRHVSPRQNAMPRLISSPPQTSPLHSARPYSPDSAQSEDIVERLQMEMANLRRQSADAISMSMQLSDQLTQAEANLSEARSAIQLVESKLREEVNKRMQAERTAEDAVRLRRAAEEALKSMRFQPELPRSR